MEALFVGIVQELVFIAALIGVTIFMVDRVKFIANNIRLGKPVNRTDHPEERRRNMFMIAFGQKKMFHKPIVGILHFIIYIGFILINIEIAEIILDGLLSFWGVHRVFSPYLGGLYPILINFFELLALGVLVTCVIFLLRRNVLRLRRFWAREITEWPRTDANVILILEITLMLALFTMNAADSILQTRAAESPYVAEHYPQVGRFLVSQMFIPLYDGLSTGQLIALERTAWWLHILGIMGFAIYVTYSKHLHVFLAFPNTYFANLNPKGKFTNMPEITKEVQGMLGITPEITETVEEEAPAEIGRFGAKDIKDLHWKNLMDAYSCTECGRCTEACPANMTGKLLSPRKIMMDTRDRMEEVGRNIEQYGKDYDDGKSLYQDYILKEEIMACTTCNACVEACPVNIDPLSIIVEIRRYIAMEESATPASWNSMFANMENNFAPWAFSPSDRFNWADELVQKENS